MNKGNMVLNFELFHLWLNLEDIMLNKSDQKENHNLNSYVASKKADILKVMS